jgi:hypothetical protein
MCKIVLHGQCVCVHACMDSCMCSLDTVAMQVAVYNSK